jgi:hypothetical protein
MKLLCENNSNLAYYLLEFTIARNEKLRSNVVTRKEKQYT